MATVKTSALAIDVASRIYQAGQEPEERTPVYGESFFLVATAPSGRRWAHRHAFLSTVWVRDAESEFGGYFGGEGRDAAHAKCQTLLNKVTARGAIELDHWEETDPEYGSEYYQQSGAEFDQIAAEREGV